MKTFFEWISMRSPIISSDAARRAQDLYISGTEGGDSESMERLAVLLRRSFIPRLEAAFPDTPQEDIEDAFQRGWISATRNYPNRPKTGSSSSKFMFHVYLYNDIHKKIGRINDHRERESWEREASPALAREADPSKIAGDSESMSKMRDALAEVLSQFDTPKSRKYLLAFCMSLGLDCGGPQGFSLPAALNHGSLRKPLSNLGKGEDRFSEKVDAGVVAGRMWDEHGIRATKLDVQNWLSYIRAELARKLPTLMGWDPEDVPRIPHVQFEPRKIRFARNV